MTMHDFREYRGMPFVKKGMKVLDTYRNRYGRIAGANHSCNLNIIFDGETVSVNCHPAWKMDYFDDDGKLIASYKE